jgi:hypothetical protein
MKHFIETLLDLAGWCLDVLTRSMLTPRMVVKDYQ